MNEPTKIKSEDGYTFYRLEDGRYADAEQNENIDMSWNSFADIIKWPQLSRQIML